MGGVATVPVTQKANIIASDTENTNTITACSVNRAGGKGPRMIRRNNALYLPLPRAGFPSYGPHILRNKLPSRDSLCFRGDASGLSADGERPARPRFRFAGSGRHRRARRRQKDSGCAIKYYGRVYHQHRQGAVPGAYLTSFVWHGS